MPKSLMSKAERVCQDLARAGGISLTMGGIKHPIVIVLVLNPDDVEEMFCAATCVTQDVKELALDVLDQVVPNHCDHETFALKEVDGLVSGLLNGVKRA